MMAATIDEIKVKSSKIPLIFEEDKRLPLVTMQFIFKNSGSVADGSKAGLAKFSSRVMNEGTKKLGSSKFAEALESRAIHISASTGRETFVLELSCLKEELDEGLKYFGMLLSDPNLSEETIKKVKTTTLGSLARKENDFDYIASNELKALLFEGSVLANPSAGTIESVKKIELKDVKEFLSKNLVASKLIVAIGGDVDLETSREKISKIIELLSKGRSNELIKYEASKDAKEKVLL
ncbi:MAG TPA: insulinase family protein, partial [Sulfurimonas sp.]